MAQSKIFDYSFVPPLTFAKRIKRIEMLPTGTYNQSLNQQDIVRFYFKSAKDLIDPWSVNVQITVQVPDNVLTDDSKFTYKCLQLDGSAQSFIQNMVIYDPQGREIERINQYSRLANFLSEMKYNPQEKGGHDNQGFGGLNLGQFGAQVSGPIPAMSNKIYRATIQSTVPVLPVNTGSNLNPNEINYGWASVNPLQIYKNTVMNQPLVGHNIATYSSLASPGESQTPNDSLIGPIQLYFSPATKNYLQVFESYEDFTGTNTHWGYPQILWGLNTYNASTSTIQTGTDWISGGSDPETTFYTWFGSDGTGGTPRALFNITADFSPVQYWSPLRSSFLTWELSPYFTWDANTGAGPIGTANGAPPSTVHLLDAFYGSGMICGSVGKQIQDRSSIQNTVNQAYVWSTNLAAAQKSIQGNVMWGASNGNQDITNSIIGDSNCSLLSGFTDSFPCNFASNCYEPIFSKTLRQRVIKNGVPSVEAIQEWTFNFPLMSGFLGSLITAERYKLIPMAVLNDVVVEFYFNPYALFTSYNTNNVQNRAYFIKDIRLTMETMVIEDSAIANPIFQQLSNWVFPTQSFYLGPQYGITANNIPPEIQYNMGFKSMRTIFYGFYRSLYSKQSNARYNYRLSGNLTSFYIQYGTENYPSIPIAGLAGSNYGATNNYEFYYELCRALDCQHDSTQKSINIHNFAINYSEIEPANFDAELNQNIQLFNKNLLESNDQLGYFYENRCVGKAMYGLDCQTMNFDQSAFSGINTSENKPFSLFMEYSNANPYPGNSEFVTWINYDMIISKSEDGFNVWGRT